MPGFKNASVGKDGDLEESSLRIALLRCQRREPNPALGQFEQRGRGFRSPLLPKRSPKRHEPATRFMLARPRVDLTGVRLSSNGRARVGAARRSSIEDCRVK